jgi:hypothetical protein
MMEIDRIWNDTSGLGIEIPTYNIFINRPRVDYRISEYVCEYICKTVLKPNSPLITGGFILFLDFMPYDKDNPYMPIESNMHNAEPIKVYNLYNTEDSVYNTEDTKFDPTKTSWGKTFSVRCYSTKFNETITPKEYANTVYDMFGAFLVNKYKRITKEVMDKNKMGMDYNYIESFEFPAKYENQKYCSDDYELRIPHMPEGSGEEWVTAHKKRIEYEREYKNILNEKIML